MRDAIAVPNAGSSSIRFALFALAGNELELTVRGQGEGLQTAPYVAAVDGQQAVCVLPANEPSMIARHTRRKLVPS